MECAWRLGLKRTGPGGSGAAYGDCWRIGIVEIKLMDYLIQILLIQILFTRVIGTVNEDPKQDSG